jgi:hypothetical protein
MPGFAASTVAAESTIVLIPVNTFGTHLADDKICYPPGVTP